jgi:hypothetical protein
MTSNKTAAGSAIRPRHAIPSSFSSQVPAAVLPNPYVFVSFLVTSNSNKHAFTIFVFIGQDAGNL